MGGVHSESQFNAEVRESTDESNRMVSIPLDDRGSP